MSLSNSPLINKTLGIIGGGQIGYMLCEEAIRRGLKTIVFDPDSDAPCKKICDEFYNYRYDDYKMLECFGEECDAITYEFENVDEQAIKKLAKKCNIPQGNLPLFYAKNRYREKNLAKSFNIPTPKYALVKDYEDLEKAILITGYPAILKTTELGYDGKGQLLINTKDDLIKASSLLKQECILEEKINFDCEVSTITFRNKKKEIVTMPITENVHHHGILSYSFAPSTLNENIEKRIIAYAEQLMSEADIYGILAIEFFIKGDEIYFNEMAPRPHNSGHHTIESCNVSQYSLLIDTLFLIPYPKVSLKHSVLMKNILGQELEILKKIKKIDDENIHIHWYEKKESRINRKMAHITFIDYSYQKYIQLIGEQNEC